MILYSKTTNGFYSSELHSAAQIPNDAVTVTEEVWQSLLAAQSAGKVIQADSTGNPVAVTPPPVTLTPEQIAQADFNAAIGAGVQIQSTSTPAFNGTYPIDSNSMLYIGGEQQYIDKTGTFSNKQTTRAWMDKNNIPHILPSTSFFTSFGEACVVYVDALQTAYAIEPY